MKARQRSSGIAAALCALLLSTTAFAVAASADPPLRPTTLDQKWELLTEEAEQERERFAVRYPFLQMPDMRPLNVVADQQWPRWMAQCLRGFGVDATQDGDRLLTPGLDTSTLPGDVVNRTCELRYPKQSRLRRVLGPYELRQLWSYYVFDLQPCLRGIGIRISRSPSFAEFLARRGTDRAWHPYSAITGIESLRELHAYDQLCPRFPKTLPA